MPFIGNKPTPAALTSSDIAADVITAAKIADDAISEEHLDATVITGLTALGATPADTDELLVSDAGTLKRVDFSYLKGGGAFTKLSSTTASGASLVAFNSLITSTYRDYRVVCSQIDGSEDADINMQISDDNGSSYQTSGNYRYKNYGYTNGGANGSGANGHTAANFLPASAEWSEAGQSVSLIIDIFNPLSTSHYFTWAVRGHYNEPASPTRQGGFYGGGAWINVYNTAYNAIKIYPTAGTFSGEITLYGRAV